MKFDGRGRTRTVTGEVSQAVAGVEVAGFPDDSSGRAEHSSPQDSTARSNVAVDAGPRFNGSDYEPEHDQARLTRQLDRVRDLMIDGRWRTLAEIEHATGAPAASASAQLRHLRKERFGGFQVEKRSRGAREIGLYEYRLLKAEGAIAPVRIRLGELVRLLKEENARLQARVAELEASP